MSDNNCTISFVLGQDPAMRFSHFQAPEPFTLLLPENTEFDIQLPGQVETLYVCLEQNRLMESARNINPPFGRSRTRKYTPLPGRTWLILGSLWSLEFVYHIWSGCYGRHFTLVGFTFVRPMENADLSWTPKSFLFTLLLTPGV